MARKGEDVELKPKTLVIDAIELLDYTGDEITIRVVCSKGTYIRALARDIGKALDSGAHLTALRRVRVGDNDLAIALSVEDAVKMLCDAPMTVGDDNGNEVEVSEAVFHCSSFEKADIKPFAERMHGANGWLPRISK